MNSFSDLNLSRQLLNAIEDLGFKSPTPIQQEAFPIVRSGKDVVGIAQTGTGKTYAYMLPILQDLKFSKQTNPRVLIVVPTRELVVQVVDQIEILAKYINVRVLGVYGGVNINTQMQYVAQGTDILVVTPGRLYDLVLNRSLSLKAVNKLIIDEVDVLLDLGFLPQLINIFELLPERRQNIMFSATMTEEVDALIDDFFISPTKIAIAVSGTPLENITQEAYPVENFYTKANLINHLIKDKTFYKKVLVFVANKKNADKLFEIMENKFHSDVCVVHSNKSQNYRLKSVKDFDEGNNRILIATDVMARGLDLNKITHVISFDTPAYPENYIHRIGRTGRAEQKGNAILFYTEKEREAKEAIEQLMGMSIPDNPFPEEVEISTDLLLEEQPIDFDKYSARKLPKLNPEKAGFHEKKEKNKKVNMGGSYRRELAKKYKKPQTRGDKKANNRKKR